MKNALELEATEERKEIVKAVISRISAYIKSRKLDEGTLTKDATLGFNLACDFLSHELSKMEQLDALEKL